MRSSHDERSGGRVISSTGLAQRGLPCWTAATSMLPRLCTTIARWLLRLITGPHWLAARLGRPRALPRDGQFLDREISVLLALDDLTGYSDFTRLSPVSARARVARALKVLDAPAPTDVLTEDLRFPGPAGWINVRAYSAAGTPCRSPGMVFFHGGGWVTGSIATHDALCCRIAARGGVRVVSVDYRLAPEHPFPAAVEDAVAAVRWVLAHAEELDIDPRRVAVAGDSAGGNLSAVSVRATRGDARRPALQVLIYPAVDATRSMRSHTTFAHGYLITAGMCDWYYGHYAGHTDRSIPELSPLLAPEVSDIPALIAIAGWDPLRDEARAYAQRLRTAGTRVIVQEAPDLVHGYALMTGACRRAREATESLIDAIGRELATAVAPSPARDSEPACTPVACGAHATPIDAPPG